MRAEDRIRLLHMVEAAQTALRFVDGKQRADLQTDQMLLFAVVRAIESRHAQPFGARLL
jgi:uncharacterized protein with HEPN domain